MSWRLAAAVVVVLAAALGIGRCWRDRGVRRVVDPWMECFECVAGERDSVVALGGRAVGRLRSYAVQGAPSGRLDRVRALEDSAAAGRRRRAASLGQDTLVIRSYAELYAANLDFTYRVRSVVALTAIATPAAKAAVNAAIAAAPTPELRARLLRADSTGR